MLWINLRRWLFWNAAFESNKFRFRKWAIEQAVKAGASFHEAVDWARVYEAHVCDAESAFRFAPSEMSKFAAPEARAN